MFQHLTHTSKLPLMDFMRLMRGVVIKGMVDGQARGPPNIEQPTMVQKKKLNKISDYGINSHIGVPSHISRIFTTQKHDVVFGETNIGVPPSLLNLSYNIYVPNIAFHNVASRKI